MRTGPERISVLESRLNTLERQLEGMDKKLDDLLILRYKGAGAFWLAATLIGTGIVGAISQLFTWFRG